MRFFGLALVASAAILGACGGNGETADTTSAATTAGATTAATTTGGTATAAPITGTTHEVKMVGDEKGYRFEPNNITVKQGDGIRFVMVSGGPHNVAFDPATIPAAGRAQLAANMPETISELNGPMKMNPNENYTISFANVAPGSYPYHCTPHLAMGMTGTITVQ